MNEFIYLGRHSGMSLIPISSFLFPSFLQAGLKLTLQPSLWTCIPLHQLSKFLRFESWATRPGYGCLSYFQSFSVDELFPVAATNCPSPIFSRDCMDCWWLSAFCNMTVTGILIMLWSNVQLNTAFGSRGRVHIQLAGIDHRVLGGLWTRKKALGRRGGAGRWLGLSELEVSGFAVACDLSGFYL